MISPRTEAVGASDARRREIAVLAMIALGLIIIIETIVTGLFGYFHRQPVNLPDWAENVLVAIATAAILKLGDCLSALIQLATGRQVAQLGSQLAQSAPPAANDAEPVPEDAKAGAQLAADKTQEVADDLDAHPTAERGR